MSNYSNYISFLKYDALLIISLGRWTVTFGRLPYDNKIIGRTDPVFSWSWGEWGYDCLWQTYGLWPLVTVDRWCAHLDDPEFEGDYDTDTDDLPC